MLYASTITQKHSTQLAYEQFNWQIETVTDCLTIRVQNRFCVLDRGLVQCKTLSGVDNSIMSTSDAYVYNVADLQLMPCPKQWGRHIHA